MNDMTLTILLPGEVFDTIDHVSHIAVETSAGMVGLLPRRRDCVATLVPGILVYRNNDQQNAFVAIDRGILVKAAEQVTITVRHAFRGKQLEELETIIADFYHEQDQETKELQTLFAKMESGLLRQLADYHHG